MHSSLSNNRDERFAWCKAKVALRAECRGNAAEGVRASGPAGGDASAWPRTGVSAPAHANDLLAPGSAAERPGIRVHALRHHLQTRSGIAGTRGHLLAAMVKLIHCAFRFTHAPTEVRLHACRAGARISIDVKDNCAGLPPGFADTLFRPFTQGHQDRSGLGLGLSFARRAVDADGRSRRRTVRDVPGTGCVFTVGIPHSSPSW